MYVRTCIGSALLLLLAQALPAAEVELTIDTIPTGAKIEMGGREVGTTPFSIEYPPAYFRAPETAFARYLAAPLILTLKKDGFPDTKLELGDGPFSWVSLNGVNRFEYYILQRAYLIKLEPPGNGTSTAENMLAGAMALEKLAKLRDDGVITEEEFAGQKAKLLNVSAPQIGPPSLSETPPPVEFCAQFLFVPSSYHKIDSEPIEPLTEETAGPTARCLWVRPAEGLTTLKVNMQCGIEDVDVACSRLQDASQGEGTLACMGMTDGEATAIYTDGCLAIAAGGGDPQVVKARVREALISYVRGYDR